MTLTKLGSVAIRLAQRNFFLQRQTIHPRARIPLRCKGSKSSDANDDDDDDLNKPIKFSASEAANWNPEYTRTGDPDDDTPWYQPYVVSASTAVFLIYFCYFREENDIDKKLTMNLSDHFQGEQKKNLEESFKLPEKIARMRSS